MITPRTCAACRHCKQRDEIDYFECNNPRAATYGYEITAPREDTCPAHSDTPLDSLLTYREAGQVIGVNRYRIAHLVKAGRLTVTTSGPTITGISLAEALRFAAIPRKAGRPRKA